MGGRKPLDSEFTVIIMECSMNKPLTLPVFRSEAQSSQAQNNLAAMNQNRE